MFSKHPSKPHLSGLREYHELYHESITKPNQFWGSLARELLSWERDFTTVHSGTLSNGENTWFCEGELNAYYNCVDRHAFKDPEKPAIMFEADETSESRTITYGELLKQVCRTAHVLRRLGVKKGDSVSIYLPMIPEVSFAILACARLGAIHSVIFAGFSSSSIADRIIDAKSRIVITSNEGIRGVTHCLVFRRTSTEISWTPGGDFWWHEEAKNSPSYISPVFMNSEDPLFLLYTSGSTGKPKGIVHSTAGYLVGAAATGKYVFDIHDSDKVFCAGDVGWITGHTYVIYAPLLLYS